MGELKKLVEEEKVKYAGLSEALASTIRRAYVVHPITSVQLEWSLWTRDCEYPILRRSQEFDFLINKHVLMRDHSFMHAYFISWKEARRIHR